MREKLNLGQPTNMMEAREKTRMAKVSFRSVFPVKGARLAIGHFNRPLADEECRKLRAAWERSVLQGVVDFEVTPKQVTFLTPTSSLDSNWRSIDELLAGVPLAKAS